MAKVLLHGAFGLVVQADDANLCWERRGMEDRRMGHPLRGGKSCVNVLPFLQKIFFHTTISRDYNNLSLWSTATTAYPWASNLPTGTANSILSPASSTNPIPSDTTLPPTPSDMITSTSSDTITSISTTTPTTSSTPTPISASTTTLPPANCSVKWDQCGGVSWIGPTFCISVSTCMKSNESFS
ncbi:hypothetical protein BDQ12DRAFT_726253 [Crucibulum laeve]|uniref:CBM1 domain-containing protein n=1 Tax=Crucibulum laeve TaxID=68775 RepID=A0A5C3M282_9AGAR|nr:hypothetical protein BDQ12DRAFT_726253 [Crucibulum laeve]